MMLDRYTKFILTVIAAALVAIAVQNATRPARAQLAQCGNVQTPCYVRNTTSDALWVQVR
jgi:hypothetical protein